MVKSGDTAILSDSGNQINKSSKRDLSSLYALKDSLETPLKKRVEILLLRIGRTQAWLAEKCEISEGCMSQIINGKWKPSSRIMVCMAEELDCDSVVLFGDSEFWYKWNDKIGYAEVKKNE